MRFLLSMLLLIFSITAIGSAVDAMTSSATPFHLVVYHNFIYTTSCSLFCATLLTGVYSRFCIRHRFIAFIAFFVLVSLGVYLGVNTAFFILHKRFASLDLRSLLVPMVFGLIASFVMMIYTLLHIRIDEKVERLRAAAEENEQLKRLESEARLASLQAKLNPHFLFNTLNSLAALVYDDPEKAENGIIKLAEVYRHVLSISNRQCVPLVEELKLIEDYLSLERLRFEDQLSYTVDLPAALSVLHVPGLLMEPLVSNVIKHALEKTDQPVHMDIRIAADAGRMRISVIDNGPGFDPDGVSRGYGHISIQERLALLFGDDFSFTLHTAPGRGVEAVIAFPLPDPSMTEEDECRSAC